MFKPSQVFINKIPPLTATMNRVEREVAAALLVRACHVHGDAWQPITPLMLGAVIEQDLKDKAQPITDMDSNPFCRPDFYELVKHGYATIDPETKAIAFTDLGLEAMRKWVRP